MEMPVQAGQEIATPEAEDQGGTSIELMVGADGSLTVSMEAGDVEGQENQEVPAKDLDDALNIIRQMATQLIDGANAPANQAEDTAFKQEMAA